MCADRRFWPETIQAFEKATGLSANNQEYWIEARAGGAPGLPDPSTANYAYNHGANIMGWAAHGDTCGGFPGVDNAAMEQKLNDALAEKPTKYPEAKHFGFFATTKGVKSWQI